MTLTYAKLADAFKRYWFSDGWEGVWQRNFRKIQKTTLHDRKSILKKIKKRFGPNRKRMFRENIFSKPSLLSSIKNQTREYGSITLYNEEEKQ